MVFLLHFPVEHRPGVEAMRVVWVARFVAVE
jgi:hypothetical protein